MEKKKIIIGLICMLFLIFIGKNAKVETYAYINVFAEENPDVKKYQITEVEELSRENSYIYMLDEVMPKWEQLTKVMPDSLSAVTEDKEKIDIPVEWYCDEKEYYDDTVYTIVFEPKFDTSVYQIEENCKLPLFYVDVKSREAYKTSVMNLTGNGNEDTCFNFLHNSVGLNCASSCGVLGNIYVESSFNPLAYNSHENAWGICQWEGGRLTNLQSRYPNSWKTLDSQLNYLVNEFNGVDYAGPKTLSYLKGRADDVNGAQEAAQYFAQYFERCAASTYASRKNWAVNFYNDRGIPAPTNPYYNSYGFDTPSNNETITEGTFLFQGWVDAKKEIASITCSINHGARYVETALYKRPDVPNATAFRVEIDSNLLSIGKNDVALCVNFKDGSATVVENRTVTWSPKLLWGFDSPTEGTQISDNQFQFSGWIETGRRLERITCSINHGEQYLTANLYKRPDVPNATAFRLDIASSNLHYGENYIAVCAHYADGTGETIAEHKVKKCMIDAMEYPQNGEKFTCKNDWFLLQGWSMDDNKAIDHFEFTINETRYTMAVHNREDLSGNARYYREQVPITRLKNGKNPIEIFAHYTDGSSRSIGRLEVIGDVDHQWDTGKVTQEATSTSKGIKTYTCEKCGTTKTEEIPIKDIVPVLSVKQDTKQITVTLSNADYVTAYGLVCIEGKESDVTLATPGRTQVAFTELTKENTFIYDVAESQGNTYRAYAVYRDENGMEKVEYSDLVFW